MKKILLIIISILLLTGCNYQIVNKEEINKKFDDLEYKKEQDRKEYVNNRIKDCYNYYFKEKENYSNAQNYSYLELNDYCYVIYKSKDEPRPKEECENMIIEPNKDYSRERLELEMFLENNCLNNTIFQQF